MIAVRLYPREEWEAQLRALGCRPLEGKGHLNTAEWWVAEMGGGQPGFVFTVPVEGPDDRVGERELGIVIAQVKKARPTLT